MLTQMFGNLSQNFIMKVFFLNQALKWTNYVGKPKSIENSIENALDSFFIPFQMQSFCCYFPLLHFIPLFLWHRNQLQKFSCDFSFFIMKSYIPLISFYFRFFSCLLTLRSILCDVMLRWKFKYSYITLHTNCFTPFYSHDICQLYFRLKLLHSLFFCHYDSYSMSFCLPWLSRLII